MLKATSEGMQAGGFITAPLLEGSRSPSFSSKQHKKMLSGEGQSRTEARRRFGVSLHYQSYPRGAKLGQKKTQRAGEGLNLEIGAETCWCAIPRGARQQALD